MGGDLALYHGLNGTLHHGSSLILGNICIKIMYTYILYSQIVHFFLAGPSNSGKTTFAVNLILYRHILFNEDIKKIIIVTPHEQSIFNELKETEKNDSVDIINELPNYEEIEHFADKHKTEGLILLLDDVIEEMQNRLQLSRIFSKLCHHKRLTCILCVQNLFFQNDQYRNMSINSTYLSLFSNPRDIRQISLLGGRMYPEQRKEFVDAFKRATKKPYSYLFIDYRQETKNFMRLRTNILPTDPEPMTMYMANE